MADSILVFAPHPDDDVIACGGVIHQTLAAGGRARMVYVTSGDGYPRAAALLLGKPVDEIGPDDLRHLGEVREAEATAGARVLGLDRADLVFLRYHDAMLATLSHEDLGSARADVARVTAESDADRVYVPGVTDEHPDHRVTAELVARAVAATEFGGDVLSYIVHAGHDTGWPLPGPRFELNTVDGVTFPAGVPWPPPVRVPLSAAESALKLRALTEHRSQWAPDHDYLGRFVKSEEIFWR